MRLLSADPATIFLGQAVLVPGTAMSTTLRDVPDVKKIEFPVAEDFQLGAAIGMSLCGTLPVCIFPRWNFLLLAMNQLVLHMDKLPVYSHGGYRPKVIVRTAVATDEPLNPGPQHLGDFTDAVRAMLTTVQIYELRTASDVRWSYKHALERDGSTILVEYAKNYT